MNPPYNSSPLRPQSLVGSTDESWGWDLGRNKLYHNTKQGSSGATYPAVLNNDETFVVPDKFLGEDGPRG